MNLNIQYRKFVMLKHISFVKSSADAIPFSKISSSKMALCLHIGIRPFLVAQARVLPQDRLPHKLRQMLAFPAVLTKVFVSFLKNG